MFVKYGKEYADLCAYTGNQAEADRALAEVEAMNKAVLADGWDGEWFVRAYDAQSNKVGPKNAKKVRSTLSLRASAFSPVSVLRQVKLRKHWIL